PMNLYIHTTTGTRYELSVPAEETVEGLKRRLSQRLKVPKERLAVCRLSSGKLQDLGVVEGSKLTLVPTVEAGLMSQASRPEQSVMQALESLTETQGDDTSCSSRAAGMWPGGLRPSAPPWHRQTPGVPSLSLSLSPQVNDFLSGRSPLTLALRVGETPLTPLPSPPACSGRTGPARRGSRTGCNPSSCPAPAPTAGRCTVPAAPASPASPWCPRASGLQNADAVFLPSQVDCGSRSSSSPGSSPAPSARSRKPGAVIESFVNHAPGVFSGTFSGTLHPNCQDSSGRPRRDIGTILQILNDLLSATRHYQGMPQSLTQLRCQTQDIPAAGLPGGWRVPPPTALHGVTPPRLFPFPLAGDRLRQTENRATRCKVERLQLLLQQKRLRRKARRDARAPYHWVPNRKAGRTNSNSSVSSEGSLDLDFEDSVWKPEVKAEMKSEFVVA
uniref:Midnolin n=1 Tax=Ficedula albicollis TaxID=59894 RepID=A0A803VUQ5_FICAL